MSVLKLDQALVTGFIAGAFGLPIAHENADYKPTGGTPFVALQNFPNEVGAVGLDDTDEMTGVFQFILYYPVGKGAYDAKAKAQAVFDYFYVGRALTYSGETLYITGTERASAFPEDGWYKVRGLIYYEARLTRP